jgi:hypothetical protein
MKSRSARNDVGPKPTATNAARPLLCLQKKRQWRLNGLHESSDALSQGRFVELAQSALRLKVVDGLRLRNGETPKRRITTILATLMPSAGVRRPRMSRFGGSATRCLFGETMRVRAERSLKSA